MNRPLYIGIHGFAGSGKDTVTKMIRTILSKNWESIDECKEYYKRIYTDPTISATYNLDDMMTSHNVYCVAFADQLKNICSAIFGIPIGRFYMNKNTAWICMNKYFKYTEIEPNDNNRKIVTADEYYCRYNEYSDDDTAEYYMSLRELLVYVGTYVLQHNINKKIFVNVVNNIVDNEIRNNDELNYVICTDVRFVHEYEYIRRMNGVVIDVSRNSVNQLDNIAEHDLDDYTQYDFSIDNSGTYDDLFNAVWDMIHNNDIFNNITSNLPVHEDINNYVRLVNDNFDDSIWQICMDKGITNITYDNGHIYMLSLIGGPIIKINEILYLNDVRYRINDILFDEDNESYYLYVIRL